MLKSLWHAFCLAPPSGCSKSHAAARFADSCLSSSSPECDGAATLALLVHWSLGLVGSDALHSFVLQYRPLFPVPSCLARFPLHLIFAAKDCNPLAKIEPDWNTHITFVKSIEHRVLESLPRPRSWLVSEIQRSGGASQWPSTWRKKSQTSQTTLQRLRAHLGFSWRQGKYSHA